MKTAIVTGGARGIGGAICRALADDGYSVVINYNKSEEKAKELLKELSGGPHIVYKADISNSGEVDEMVRAAAENFGGVDVLVNNAGIGGQKLFSDITDREWNEMISINLSGAFYCCRAVLPYMLKKKSGSIINISSVWGIVGGACEVHYSASKAGLLGLTKALSKELAPSGITVNAVAPGIVDTDMMLDLDDLERNELLSETPLRRFGTPEDIARAVLYIVGDSFLTGQVLSPNGGFVIY